jgi:hypothetical protein
MAISLPIVSKYDDKGVKEAQVSVGGLEAIALGAFAKIGAMATEAFARAAQGAVQFGESTVKAAIEAQAVTRQLENAAKNSGAFGDTADSIKQATDALDKHSTALAELSGVDDETINKIKSRWMTVPSIVALGTKGINHLAEVSADVAAATGKDIESIGLMFTKVAGDNETALSKLTRAGVVLSDGQKKTYQNLLDTNREAEAQAYLIDQLALKYQGSALAMADPIERLKVTWENLQETIGMALMPALELAIPKLQEFINTYVTSPEFKQFLIDIGNGFAVIMQSLPGVLSNLGSFAKDVLPVLKSLFPFVNEGLSLFAALFLGISRTDGAGNANSFAQAMQNVAGGINATTDAIKGLTGWWDSLPSDLKQILGLFQPNIFGASNAIANWVSGFRVDYSKLTKDSEGRDVIPFASGGIVTGATRAIVGEAGPEAIIPLDRLAEVTGMGTGGGGISITVNAGMGTDGAALGEQIVNAIRRYERTSGAVFARA